VCICVQDRSGCARRLFHHCRGRKVHAYQRPGGGSHDGTRLAAGHGDDALDEAATSVVSITGSIGPTRGA
jgi:hypothetical protein